MRLQSRLLWGLISGWTASLVVAQNFAFTTGNPTQCDDLTINWQGGQPPIVVTLSPPNGTARNTTIPGSASSGGSFGVPIPFAKGQTLLVTLSDATGFASGGTTQLLTVGSPVKGNNCNTTDIGVDFFYQLDSPLSQCQPYPFTGFAGATQPVTIFALIPGGQSVVLNPPISNTNSFNWPVNVKAGTSLVFTMVDAKGRDGGTSGVRVVGNSADSSCLTNALSSTPAATLSASPTSTPSQTDNPPNSQKSKKGFPVVTVAAVAGGVVALLIIISLLLFCMFKRKGRSDDFFPPSGKQSAIDLNSRGDYSAVGVPPGQFAPTPFVGTHSTTPSFAPSGHYAPAPFPSQPSTPTSASFNHTLASFPPPNPPPPFAPPPVPSPSVFAYQMQRNSLVSSTTHLTTPTAGDVQLPQPQSRYSVGAESSSDADAYTAYAGGTSDGPFIPNHPYASTKSTAQPEPSSATGSRFVMHSDIAEGEDVVELPPQYSESRAPLPEGFMSDSKHG